MRRWLIAAAIVLGLALAEWLSRVLLAETGAIAALLAPGGHSSPLAVGSAVAFLLLRLFVLVLLPAAGGAALALKLSSFVISAVYARKAARAARRALSSPGQFGSGGRNVQER